MSANKIAKWDGNSWSALGSGLGGVQFSSVYAIAISGNDIYAGGEFTQAGGISANYIAKWEGNSWSALGSGLGSGANSFVNAIAISENDIYVGGNISLANGISAHYVAKWDGNSWSALGGGLGGVVNTTVAAIAISGNDVYVGGYFTEAGGISANRIAKWDGNSWSALGSGVNDNVRAIAISGNDIYVGGRFTQAGGISANRIAKWDGNSWSALGSGVNSFVNAIAISGNDVYAGGYFTGAGGISANRIAKWDGSSWSALGSGISGFLNAWVNAIAISGNDIYVGGDFTQAGGISANRIAKWDGNSWSALGSGLNSTVRAIAISENDIYAGGEFTQAGGISPNYIAKWDGSSWSAIPGLNAPVYSLLTTGNNIIAGGQSQIKIFNGNTWINNFSLDATVYALIKKNNEIYAGGSFTQIGGLSSKALAYFINDNPMSIFIPGDVVYIGEEIIISWDVFYANNLKIEYSTNNGSTWSVIQSSIPTISNFYEWTVPNTPTTQGKIRISDAANSTNFVVSPVFQISDIATVILSSPANNSLNQNLPITFQWQEAAGPINYRLQVSKNLNFSTTVVDELVNSTSKTISTMDYGTKYYWRVRAERGNLYGDYSEVRNFRTKLNQVTLSSPANNSSSNSLGTSFTWQQVTGTERYHLQISTVSNFQNLFFNDSTISATSKTVGNFQHNQQYYWRVRAINQYGSSEWSDVYSITAMLPDRNVQLFADTLITTLPCYINVMFHALDQNNQGVTDLTVEEFIVKENNQVISPSESNLQIGKADQLSYEMLTVLMLDNSSSIGPNDLEIVKAAARELVRTKLPDQEISVYVFSENPVLLQEFTADTTALISAINSISTGFPTTNLYGSIIEGVSSWDDLFTLDLVKQGTMILLTDGEDTQGSSTLEEALAAIGNKRVIPVGLGNEINPTVLSQIGGGGFIHVTNINQLIGYFVDIQNDLIQLTNSFYWMNYQTPKRGDNWHTLTLSLQNNQNTGSNSAIDVQFNSNGFYSVWPGIVVNPTPQNPFGEDEITIPANSRDTINIEAPFTFNSLPFDFEIADPSLLTIETVIDRNMFKFIGTAQQGQSTSVIFNDLTNNFTKTLQVNFSAPVTSVREETLPTEFSLSQNYPNPFNPNTKIQYSIPEQSEVTIKVYDLIGREVSTLVNKEMKPGFYEAEWHAGNFSSGVYFYRITTTTGFTAVKKLMLIK